jgi:transglutaminase-like putative cysteine protease
MHPGARAPKLSLPRSGAGLLLWLATLAGPVAAQDPAYRVGPAPEWIVPVEVDLAMPTPTGQISDGVFHLLGDMQLRAGPGAAVRYNRFATRAVDSQGLAEVAQVEIGFDPSFQTLTLHHVDVVRDGRRVARLPGAEVRVIQREKELEYRIYDGRKTATLFLEDVRVGDVVDYAFSIEGENPAFAGRVFGQTPMQWGVPVGVDHTRLLLPAGRRVDVQSRNGAPEPVVRERPPYREYIWLNRDVKPLHGEDGEPAWLDRYAHARWSEFPDWAAVAAWAAPLYATDAPLGAELDARVAAIAREHAAPEARTAAVLRFVQGDIRYLGVEVGIGSFRPNPPRTVFERRFGDCKDKTLLMLALLDRLGIEAQPALVHTEVGRGLPDALVAPNSFNHVIVRARIDGRDYWLDPTRDTQPGRLDRVFQPDFGSALLVAAEGGALVDMQPSHAAPRRQIDVVIDARKGMDAPATMSVTTTMEFGAAEGMRSTLASKPREEIAKDYLNFYSNYYHGLRSAGPLEVEDDTVENRIVLVERYEVDDFWTAVDDEGLRTASVTAADLYDYLKAPSAPRRQTPLAINHPVDVTLTTDVRLHEDWPIKDERAAYDSPGFRLERSVRGEDQGRRVVMVDRFQSLAHQIPAESAPGHAAKLEQAGDALGYQLTWRVNAGSGLAGGVNWTVAMIAMLLTGIYLAVAVLLYRHDPAGPSVPVDPALQGISGWLVLPAIGIVLTPLVVLAELITGAEAYSLATWTRLTAVGGEQYHALWEPLLLFGLAANLAILVLSCLVLVVFFQRRRSAPRLYIAMICGSALVLVVDHLGAWQIPDANAAIAPSDVASVGHSVLSAILWTSYFLLSKRVKSTFVRVRRPPAPAVAEPPPLPAA